MQTQPSQPSLPGTNVSPLSRGKRGRKSGRQEDAVDVTKIQKIIGDRIGELVVLHVAASSASDDLSSAVKKAAEDCGLNAKAVRQFVTARAGDKFEKARKSCEQLALLFEEVGEQ